MTSQEFIDQWPLGWLAAALSCPEWVSTQRSVWAEWMSGSRKFGLAPPQFVEVAQGNLGQFQDLLAKRLMLPESRQAEMAQDALRQYPDFVELLDRSDILRLLQQESTCESPGEVRGIPSLAYPQVSAAVAGVRSTLADLAAPGHEHTPVGVVTPNVRGEAGPTVRRQAREVDDSQRHLAGLVACRWASPRTRG